MTSLARRPNLAEMAPGTVVTPAEVAAFLCISVRQLSRLEIPRLDLSPRCRRYCAGDVVTWLERQKAAVA